MRRWRRVIAPALGATLVAPALFLSPANAQSAATFTSPGDGAKVSGWVTVAGQANVGAAGLKGAQLYIGGVLVREIGPFDCPNNRSGETLSYDWNTHLELSGGGLAPNQQHTIKLTTIGCDAEPVEDSITAYVNNPPEAPRGVSASVSGQTATVSWNANPEPDLAGYAVVRDGMSTTVTTTRFSEDLSPGTYSYRITALRKGTHGVLSSPTVSSNQVTVEPSSSSGSSGSSSPSPSDETSGSSSPSGADDSGGDPGWGKVHDDVSPGGDPGWGKVHDVSLEGTSGWGGIPDTFQVAAARLTPLDLPAMMTLRLLSASLPPLDPVSDPTDPSGGWGEFTETAPYEPPVDTTTSSIDPGFEQLNIAARSPDRILPPDQMRWLLAGLIAMTLAGLFLYLDLRLHVGTRVAVLGDAPHGGDGMRRASRAPRVWLPSRLFRRRSPASLR